MQKWEYRQYIVSEKHLPGLANWDDLINELNVLGQDGCELVHLEKTEVMICILKRPLNAPCESGGETCDASVAHQLEKSKQSPDQKELFDE